MQPFFLPVLCSYQHLQTSFSLSCGLQELSQMQKINKQLITVNCVLRKILSLSSVIQSRCFYDSLSHALLLCPLQKQNSSSLFFFFSPSNVSLLRPLNCSVNFQKPVKSHSSLLWPCRGQGSRLFELHHSMLRQTRLVEWKRKKRLKSNHFIITILTCRNKRCFLQPKLNFFLCSRASFWLYYGSLSVETFPLWLCVTSWHQTWNAPFISLFFCLQHSLSGQFYGV